MRKIATLFSCLLFYAVSSAQLIHPFVSFESPSVYRSVHFDRADFDVKQLIIPHIKQLKKISLSPAIIELPLPDGGEERFIIAETNVLSEATARMYPFIKNYDVQSVDGYITGRLTLTQLGLHAILFTPDGIAFIEPLSINNPEIHIVYFQRDFKIPEQLKIICGVEHTSIAYDYNKYKTTAAIGDCMLRTYNLAVAATGEYTALAGSQANAIASITQVIAAISAIYEREATIKFMLVTNNSVIYTNAVTDPYPTLTFPDGTVLNANTTALNTNIGPANYDVGIVFHDGWSGGFAYTPAACGPNKGGSAAGSVGQTYGSALIRIASHEIAHMFSALHTMSAGTDAGCAGNLSLSAAYEPGGGSTIMAYAGAVCTGLSYQTHSDDYFHYNSVNTIMTYAQSLSCGTTTAIANTAPTLTVPASGYIIPHSTPFELTANGADANGNSLTYTFEQYDAALSAMTTPPASTNATGPLFRSYPPSGINKRIFPSLANILSNTPNTWEVLPSVSRPLNFRILVRDNAIGGGCLAQESVVVNVNNIGGPFSMTSQNATGNYTANGINTMAITWNVANTTAAPISSPNVDILFSTDNGQTFPYTLASNTPNDGSENVIVPNLNTPLGRIKVKSSNNIFFDINNEKQTINSTCTAKGSSFTPSNDVTAAAGNAALNLNLSPVYGTPMAISGTLEATDPFTNLAVVNLGGSNCLSVGNTFKYDVFTFQVNAAGVYTFTQSAGTPFGTVFNLYEAPFDPISPCTNFITSNAVYPGGPSVTINNFMDTMLLPGISYVIAIGTFSGSLPSLPAAYTINVSGPAGGGIYSNTPDPGANFYYRFVIVNNTTGNIVAFSTDGNMTNATTFPNGTYSVYGVSLHNSVTSGTLNTYVNGSFATFQMALLNSVYCGNLSSNSITVTITAPLDILVINTVATQSNDDVEVSWNVNPEKNIRNYLIEKGTSVAGFKAIGNVVALGKGNYSFVDDTPQPENYYRIKALSFSGQETYSNIAYLRIIETNRNAIVFPNPTSGIASIKLFQNDRYDCALFDISGKEIWSQVVTGNDLQIDMGKFMCGIYILKCRGENNHFVLRLIRE